MQYMPAMSQKRKPGRPNTHLSEKPRAIRMPQSLHDQIHAAAEREGLSWSEWWRRAVTRALEGTR